MGRGRGQVVGARDEPVRRAAAAPLHRAGPRGRARSPADGRALLRPRPGGHPQDRGAHRSAQAAGHDRGCYAQHAAGGPGRRHDRLHAERRAGRGRPDGEDVHEPGRRANGAVRDREVRLMEIETRHEYREELERLEARALDGLDLVVAALDRTVEAIQHQDIELAELVIADDDVIDGRYLEIHQQVLTLLATQAPVATDLRLISALLHVMKNIERMGDQCVNIAKLIPIAGHEPPADELLVSDLVTMGRAVRAQIRQSKRAFADRDVDMARDLVRQDDVVDTLNREWAMTMMLVARALERIGDNAVDVGEQVAFVVTGLFREFEDASHPGEDVLPQPSSA